MAVSVDATVGGVSANSYVSVAACDTYHDSLPSSWATDWTSASADDKSRAVVTATRNLDYFARWKSFKVSEDQALRHPRQSLVTVDGETIADTALAPALVDATCELARYYVTSNLTAPNDADGIESLNVAGAISISFTSGNSGGAAVPQAIKVALAHLVNGWDDPKTGASKNKMVRG